MIFIKNIKDGFDKQPYQVKVCRPSVLGNPFYLDDESKRDEVCDKYETWFYNQLNRNDFLLELKRLHDIYNKYGTLELFCWCYPKRCHAETIKIYLESI